MTQTKTQFYWHIHHDRLIELLTEPIKDRIQYIRKNKPENEIELRLKLLKPVMDILPKDFIEAYKAWYEAYKAWYEADKAWDEAYKTRDEANKTRDEAHNKNLPLLEELHKKECPGCPWNGKTIFSQK